MSATPKHANLATALAAFQAEMPTVAKAQKATVPTKTGGSYSYTYAGLPGVTDAVIPALTRHGLSFSCCPARCDDGSYELRGTLLHEAGEKLEGALPIQGRAMQEIGSSITYSRRYLLGCMTGVVTDDDDDGNLGNTGHASRSSEPAPRPITARTRGQLFALFAQKGIGEDRQLDGINKITGGGYTSRGDLSEPDALAVIKVLQTYPDKPAPDSFDKDADHAAAVQAEATA